MRKASMFLWIAFLFTGCVHVTEPLSDPNKAEPDKRLLGKWRQPGKKHYVIDSPPVKGHPKALIRAALNKAGKDVHEFWFITTTIGKNTYATIYLKDDDAKPVAGYADFRQEGAFEKWNKGNKRSYFIFRYVVDGDKLTVDGGSEQSVKEVMKDQDIQGVSGRFQTPPGWLAKYLDKHGPQTPFDGKNVEVWRRPIE